MKSDRRNMEKSIGRYMQEIRDVVKAGLSRRELLRMGLVSGSSGLLALYGMRHFKPYSTGATPNSPPKSSHSTARRTRRLWIRFPSHKPYSRRHFSLHQQREPIP